MFSTNGYKGCRNTFTKGGEVMEHYAAIIIEAETRKSWTQSAVRIPERLGLDAKLSSSKHGYHRYPLPLATAPRDHG